MKDHFLRCDGSRFDIPLHDPIVAAHFQNPATLTDHLIDQMGKDSIYYKMFDDRKDLVFLDIGANIGLISLYAAPACKRIVALEPAPDTYEVLLQMVLSTENILPLEMALAPTDERVTFYQNDINPTASSTVNTYGKRIDVPGMKLSSILNAYKLDHVDVCKIDAEGAEGDSLTFEEIKHASGIIDQWYIELHNCPKSTWEFKLGNIMRSLQAIGYGKFLVDGMTLHATK